MTFRHFRCQIYLIRIVCRAYSVYKQQHTLQMIVSSLIYQFNYTVCAAGAKILDTLSAFRVEINGFLAQHTLTDLLIVSMANSAQSRSQRGFLLIIVIHHRFTYT